MVKGDMTGCIFQKWLYHNLPSDMFFHNVILMLPCQNMESNSPHPQPWICIGLWLLWPTWHMTEVPRLGHKWDAGFASLLPPSTLMLDALSYHIKSLTTLRPLCGEEAKPQGEATCGCSSRQSQFLSPPRRINERASDDSSASTLTTPSSAFECFHLRPRHPGAEMNPSHCALLQIQSDPSICDPS